MDETRETPRSTGEVKPGPQELTEILHSLEGGERLAGGRFLFASVVGSWADGSWEPGHDVDVRAVYVLPTEAYLGLGSFPDEVEILEQHGSWELDLVAFEIEKVIRLMLKGHEPTLAWLGSEQRAPVIWQVEGAEVLVNGARQRARAIQDGSMAAGLDLPPLLYRALEALVIKARLGELGR